MYSTYCLYQKEPLYFLFLYSEIFQFKLDLLFIKIKYIFIVVEYIIFISSQWEAILDIKPWRQIVLSVDLNVGYTEVFTLGKHHQAAHLRVMCSLHVYNTAELYSRIVPLTTTYHDIPVLISSACSKTLNYSLIWYKIFFRLLK